MEMTEQLERTLRSLDGLALGDAFGELAFEHSEQLFGQHQPPPGPWPWTDDTHMALSIVEVLRDRGMIEVDELARAFAARYKAEPDRGYADGAITLLRNPLFASEWRQLSQGLFDGEGSWGNGGGMRAAPIGAWFAGDPERTAHEARQSALMTHAHAEGQAGAIAVAVMASLVAADPKLRGHDLIRATMAHVPPGDVADNMEASLQMDGHERDFAIHRLGCGWKVSAMDTIPYALWCAAFHLDDFEEAIWFTAAALGDCDTTCAIVGGIVALTAPALPEAWLREREPLPEGFRRAGT